MRAFTRFVLLAQLVGCVTDVAKGKPPPVAAPPSPREVRCPGAPLLGNATGWRHLTSKVAASLGDPHHRGIDLISTATAATQTLAGKLTYGPIDKDVEDEDVDVLACTTTGWHTIATARTDDDGRFRLVLDGDRRLGIGLRDMFLSVRGDRTSARFLAFVAPADAKVIVSDVDGTLTSSENAYPISLATRRATGVQAGAAAALAAATAQGYTVIYISSRGDRFTQDTRDWFADNGFPRGPIRLPRSIITLPGEDTVEFKTAALRDATQFDLEAGIGNRKSDVAAYAAAGLPPTRIFIKLAEFIEEVRPDLDAGRATGFSSYAAVKL